LSRLAANFMVLHDGSSWKSSMIYSSDQQFAFQRDAIGRRGFLGSAIGSIASIAPVPIVASEIGETAQNRCKALYRKSPDIEAFYRVNRYP
jgi:hypothetical protein